MIYFPNYIRTSKTLVVIICILGFAALNAVADTYNATNSSGYAQIDTPFSSGVNVRVGSWLTMNISVGVNGGYIVDYGTGFGSIGSPGPVAQTGPYWLDSSTQLGPGTYGPNSASIRWFYRGAAQPYLHVTFFPGYNESNPGFFTVNVQGAYSYFSSIPSSIAQGDVVSVLATGADDNGLLSSVTTQISVNGGAWSSYSSVGSGGGWSSVTPAAPFTAAAAGTTYQFRTWAIDANGYQSQIVASAVYTVQVPPPPTQYYSAGVDISALFAQRNGGAQAANTKMTCVIGGTTYDLAQVFLARSSAPRANVGIVALNGQDLAQIFEKK